MRYLGLNALSLASHRGKGVGSDNVLSYFTPLAIDVPGIATVQVEAAFTAGMDHIGFGVLGQQGFFEAFMITFELSRRFFYLGTS